MWICNCSLFPHIFAAHFAMLRSAYFERKKLPHFSDMPSGVCVSDMEDHSQNETQWREFWDGVRALQVLCDWLTAGNRVALLVNNLGSTSDLEMNIVALEAIKHLGNETLCLFFGSFVVLLSCWQVLYLSILCEWFHLVEIGFCACSLQCGTECFMCTQMLMVIQLILLHGRKYKMNEKTTTKPVGIRNL